MRRGLIFLDKHMSSPGRDIKHLKVPKLFGSAGVGPLHSPAVGVVPATHPALVLSFAGANLLVTAHFHAFPTDTDAVGIPVGAASPVVHWLLHVSHIPRFSGLAVQVTSLGSCGARENKGLQGGQ